MKRMLKVKISTDKNARSLYQELKLTFLLMRIFGLAPFSVKEGQLIPSRIFRVQNYLLAAATIFCGYTVFLRGEYNVSKSALSVLMYKVIGSSKCLHVVLCLLNFSCRTRLYLEIWSLIQDINLNLEALSIKIDVSKYRKTNLLTTIAFIACTVIYFVLYSAIFTRHLSLCFWIIAIVPPFYTTLAIFLFCIFTTKIRDRVSLVNAFFQEELQTYKIRLGAAVNVLYRSEYKTRGSARIAKKFRVLKIIHLKVYKSVKYLNGLFGIHFFIIFVLYFCTGTLYTFTIIRYFTGQATNGQYRASVYAIVGETMEILLAIYGATILEKEVRCTLMLVHKFLTLVSESDVTLEHELQSFAIQLHQCRVGFTAHGFFSMDYTKLLQFGVAFFSNAVFFLQIDKTALSLTTTLILLSVARNIADEISEIAVATINDRGDISRQKKNDAELRRRCETLQKACSILSIWLPKVLTIKKPSERFERLFELYIA